MIINFDLSLNTLPTCVFFTVKSLIKYYTYQNIPVKTCLLDASKAFERLNHTNAKCLHKMGQIVITIFHYFKYRAAMWNSLP